MRRPAARPAAATSTVRQNGFTLIELLVVAAIAAMLLAIIVPNLGALVPTARLSGSGNEILRNLDWLRSEARIQGKRMAIDFDLDKGRWIAVFPPEQKLTRDQDVQTLEEQFWLAWKDLETDVTFASIEVGNTVTTRGVYRLQFDEFGFTADQVINLRLRSDPEQVWSLTIQGLNGRVSVDESDKGELVHLPRTGEGAF